PPPPLFFKNKRRNILYFFLCVVVLYFFKIQDTAVGFSFFFRNQKQTFGGWFFVFLLQQGP
ncbi:hypothetical protein, partial [Enterobacter hormaechei]